MNTPLRIGLAATAALILSALPTWAADFTVETAVLDNGLQVVVVPDHRAPLITQAVYYKAGAADEPAGKGGLAHFLEHMMFQGTSNVPGEDYRNTIARHGGEENAFTAQDMTGYWQTVAVEAMEIVMELESDRMANLRILPEEFESERQVIKEERRSRYESDPRGPFSEHMSAAVFMAHPYRLPVIGWMHEIESHTVQDAIDWYDKYYVPNNAILVISGDTILAEVLPLAEKYYGVIPRGADVVRSRPQEPPQLAERRVILYDERVREPSFSRSYVTNSRTTRDGLAPALSLLSQILSGSTGRLYQALVVDQGIATSAGAFYSGGTMDQTQFGMWIAPARGADLVAMEAALDVEIARVVADGITQEELDLARNGTLSGLVFSRDSVTRLGRRVGAGLAVGLTIEEIVGWSDEISAVTVADVNAAVATVFNRAHSATGLMLPPPDKE
jgi:zinc protease